MAPQLSMTAPSGEQPAFGGGMAPPPAGSDGGGLFGLAARTPKFEPELASQSQSLFLPKRRKVEEELEPTEDMPQPEAAEPAPQQGLPTMPSAFERAPEPPAPEQAEPAPPAPVPEQAPEQAYERPREQQEPQTPEPMAMPPLPERPTGARAQSGEHPGFIQPAPQMGAPAASGPEATHEAMPPVDRRQPMPPQPEQSPEPRPDETQVAMSPRFDAVEEATGGTRPRDEFEQFAPPQEQTGGRPDHGQPDHGQPEQAQQPPTYGDPSYAPLAPQLEPDQAQWSPSYEQPHDQQPYDQPYDQQPFDQGYDQGFEPPYGQPQDGSQDPYGQQAYGDPYAQNPYNDATLVGQPPISGGPSTPAPPPMAPQGYDPYANSFDARYEPQRGQGKSVGGLDLKRWGLIVLVVAVVVAIIAFIIGLVNNSDDASAETGGTQGAVTTEGGAAAEAKKIDELIKTSAKDKAAIGAAQADLEACENIDEAIQTFQDAAASRQKLAKKVTKIDTAVLPGSRKLVKNLESAWLTAQNADLAFAAWGEKRKVNGKGECVGGKRKLEKATTLSLASHEPKKAAAKAWGPIAEEYGLDPVKWKKL